MPRISIADLQRALGGLSPTEEQAQAIEGAPVRGHALVIAGAGSGKTQLMSARAAFLVANEFAEPGQILGLTFTRKAAAELSQRILANLHQLRETEFWPAGLDFDFAPPNITTYNSFADQLFRQSALSIGYDPDATLLSEASAFQLALELVNSPGPELAAELAGFDQKPATIAGQVLRLSQELVDNGVTADAASQYLSSSRSQISSLPQKPSGGTEIFAYTRDYLDSLSHNEVLVRLAREFQHAKRAANQIDFADQVALASQIKPERFDLPYRFVLLDEYQDTSAMQAQLLSRLFGERSVMAVGDANQAIYGWRGAGSDSLAKFFGNFGGEPKIFTLSTSWRCSKSVLEVANSLAGELASSALPSLELQPSSSAQIGSVTANFFQSVADEAEAIADWLEPRVTSESTQALLLRGRALMPHYAAALTNRGFRVEVSGVGGLTTTPEVLDLISALRVVEQPEAGAALMRLLAGSRWRISPRDIAQLSRFAQLLTRIRPEANSSNPVTIIEALDELPRTKTETQISPLGLDRMRAAADFFLRLRKQSGLKLIEFVRLVAQDLNLDIELLARGRGLENLEAFFELVHDFEATNLRPTLRNFLQWLDYAEDRERLEPPKGDTKAGVIQILTAHSAKGLEWQFVAVPNLVENEFPMRSKEPRGWLTAGRIPGPLRADAAELPQWNLHVGDQQQLKKEFEDYKQRLAAFRELEERRLAYVASTRAKQDLWLSGAFWKPGNSTPRQPSGFLLEVATLLDVELSECESDQNPFSLSQVTATWPRQRENQGLQADALAVLEAEPSQLAELNLLLQERELRLEQPVPTLPARLSASAVTQLIESPIQFAEALLRPMPARFTEGAAIGTEFHAALELGLEPAQDLSDALDQFSVNRPDSQLAERFLSSEFADREPLYREQSIEFELGGFVVACKLDAVYLEGDYRIVDWKTGVKSSHQHLLQLAIYRAALAEWLDVGPERVTASLFYVADSELVTPERLMSKLELEHELAAAKKALQSHFEV